KWLVLAVLVRFPFTRRFWALPILIALCQSQKEDKQHHRRHKTPAQVLAQLLLLLRRWFPDRTFVGAADGGFASHELAGSVARARGRTQLVSRFYPNAGLYDPRVAVVGKANGKRATGGKRRVKGDKRATPQEVVAQTAQRQRLRVSWYGGGQRTVEVVSGTGHWYKAGQELVELRWVYVHDLE